jgi:DNA-binding IscR family transcriptional regulator
MTRWNPDHCDTHPGGPRYVRPNGARECRLCKRENENTRRAWRRVYDAYLDLLEQRGVA